MRLGVLSQAPAQCRGTFLREANDLDTMVLDHGVRQAYLSTGVKADNSVTELIPLFFRFQIIHTATLVEYGQNCHDPLMGKLRTVPMPLDEANAFVDMHHRHHTPSKFHKFSIGAVLDLRVVGVVMVNRPVAIARDDGATLEVIRLATDGTRNACSFLYGAAAKATFALGYDAIGTYILAGWRCLGERGGGTWDRANRPRVDKHPTQGKLLFEASR